MTKTGLSLPPETRQETLVMAKTPSQPRARGKSKPAKAAAARSAASRAKRRPPGDGPAARPKTSRAKTAERRIEPPAPKAAAAPNSASLGAAFEEQSDRLPAPRG